MSDRRRHGSGARYRRGRRRRVLPFVLVALALVAVAAVGVDIAVRAVDAKNALTDAQARLSAFKASAATSPALQTMDLYDAVHADTTRAAAQLGDPIWIAAEHLPLLGPNLLAFRQTTDAMNDLVGTGVEPLAKAANGIGYNSLKPQNGRIDIAPLKTLTPAMSQVDAAVARAQRRIDAVDVSGVLPQLRTPILKLKSGLDEAAPVTHELVKVMPVLYPALGGEGTRHYLLIFQNNAEERASGGNPASMAMLDVADGKVSLARQGNSGDFPHPYHHAPVKWDGDWAKLYGPHITKYVSNITYDPDFPDVAQMAMGMWQDVYRDKADRVDGVISFDPVALSYLLRATGPIHLATGESLTSDNAVEYLLSGVYAKYTDPKVQDAVFASAAQAVFTAVTNGQGSPQAYLAQLPQMMTEQRLKLWSTRPAEERLLLTSPVGNMLPADNSQSTTVGVYTNDDATSKMSYFMKEPITLTSTMCPATTPTYDVSLTVHDTLTTRRIASLTQYVLANQSGIVPGGDRERVMLYGPVGSKLVSATIDGKKVVWGDDPDYRKNTVADATGEDDHRPAVQGELHGRPVGSVSVKMGPGGSVTVTARFSGGTSPSKTVTVSRTPQARANLSPVTLRQGSCG